MPRITISYRRTDSAAMTGRIFDRLTQHFGADSVFMDIDTIPFGVDFRHFINDALKTTDFMLVVIGPQWLGDGVNRFASARRAAAGHIDLALAHRRGRRDRTRRRSRICGRATSAP
jgi:hypothetical protein